MLFILVGGGVSLSWWRRRGRWTLGYQQEKALLIENFRMEEGKGEKVWALVNLNFKVVGEKKIVVM